MCQPVLTANDLRADEGRETKALNCKPNTNLKEISELSNYYKTSGFRLHAVIFSALHSLHQNKMHAIHASRGGVWWGKQYERHQLKFRFYTMIVTLWSSHCSCLSRNPCHAAGGVWWGKQNDCHIMVVTQCLSKR